MTQDIKSLPRASALATLGMLAACGQCESHEEGRQRIAGDGTSVFVQYSHCSALNNDIEFYVARPDLAKFLIGKGSDLEEYGVFYDDRNQTIILLTPLPTDIHVTSPKVGPYRVKVMPLRVRGAEDEQYLAAWRSNPDSADAKRWMRAHLGI